MFYQNCGKALLFFLLALSPLASQAGDIEFNGFGSAYYGQNLNSNLLAPSFADSHTNFSTFSDFGLNMSAKLTDEFSADAQLVAFGLSSTSTWGVNANWAYLIYRPTSSTLVKMGRQLYPAYLASEYLSVGYLQPFRRLPPTIYNVIPYTGFDGVSITQMIADVGSIGKISLSAFVGGPNLSVGANAGGFSNSQAVDLTNTSVSDSYGVALALDGDGYRIQIHADRAQVRLPVNLPPFLGGPVQLNAHPMALAAGYRFDKYNIVSWAEMAWSRAPDGTPVMFPNGNPNGSGFGDHFLGEVFGAYALVGYRLGPLMPRYTYGTQEAHIGITDGTFKSHTFGLNYQFIPQGVLKVEYEISSLPDANSGTVFFTRAPGTTDLTATAFYAGVDFIF